MEVLKSTKGKDKIAYRGFVYRRDHKSQTRISWRCERKECKGRLATPLLYEEDLDDAVERGEHSHPPDVAGIELAKVKDGMLAQASTTNDPPRRILEDNIGGVSEETAARIGSGTNLKKAVTRKRKREEDHPPPAHHAADIQLPQSMTQTTTGANFIVHDSGPGDQNRLIIFGTQDSLRWLRENPHWLADGTFKIAPEVFLQVYTVHVVLQQTVIPCLYALMRNKTEAMYDRMWEAVTQAQGGLNPQTVMADFEVGARNSVKRRFPNVQIAGCFFHLGQTIWRKICNQGQRNLFLQNENFRLHIKMLTCLSFLPPPQVPEGFEALQESDGYDPQTMDATYDFFEDNYVGRLLRNGNRRVPRFPIRSWNSYMRLQDNVPRTNNAVEGWHTAFQGSLQSSHPTTWKLIQALQKEENLQRVRYHGIMAGEPQARKKKYVTLERRIQTVVNDRQNRSLLEYLRGISYNISVGDS